MVKIVQLKMSTKNLKDNVAFYEASEDSLKSELAISTTEATRPGQLFVNVLVEVIDLKGKLAARDVVVPSVVEGSCVTHGLLSGTWSRISVQVFTGKFVELFVLAGLTLTSIPILPSRSSLSVLWGRAASKDGGGSTRDESNVDQPVDSEVI